MGDFRLSQLSTVLPLPRFLLPFFALFIKITELSAAKNTVADGAQQGTVLLYKV